MAKGAGKIQEPETGIALDLGGDEFAGLVAASVIDKDDSPRQIRGGIEHSLKSPKKFGQDRRFIEDRDDNGDGWLGIQGDTPMQI